MIAVEVAYAAADRRHVVRLSVAPDCSVGDAIRLSGLLEECAEIDLARNAVGLFGRRVALDDALTEGDRVEIYRPLKRNPMAARHRRAHRSGT